MKQMRFDQLHLYDSSSNSCLNTEIYNCKLHEMTGEHVNYCVYFTICIRSM